MSSSFLSVTEGICLFAGGAAGAAFGFFLTITPFRDFLGAGLVAGGALTGGASAAASGFGGAVAVDLAATALQISIR